MSDPQAVLSLVHQMHQRGVLQRDLHPGNILLASSGEMRLVDLYGIVIRPSLTADERAANLALLRTSLPIPVSPDIQQMSVELRKAALARRSKRCFWHNREFAPRLFGGTRWQVRLPFMNSAVEKILADPDEFLRGRAEILKAGGSSTVGRADGHVLKRFNLRKAESLLKDLFRASRARRAFRKAYHLELCGIPTAKPIAVADRRVFGFLNRSYVLMQEIPGAVDLKKWRGDRRHAVRCVAELVGKLHNEGFRHRDLKETNLVFDSQDRLFLLDLDGLEFMSSPPLRRIIFDLERLLRASRALAEVTPADRRSFLRHYSRARRMRPRELRD